MRDISSIHARLADYATIHRVASRCLSESEAEGISPERREFLVAMAAYAMCVYDEALAHFLESYRLAPTAECAARVALSQWRMGETSAAEEWIQRAIVANPEGILEATCIGSVSCFQSVLASFKLSAGAVEDARSLIDTVLKERPSEPLALSVFANCLLLAGDASGAAVALDRAIAVAPEFTARTLTRERKVVLELESANSARLPFRIEIAALALRSAV